ncbi:hypothetical protein ACHQM5_023926 [Ranunculus cassubicifolius]
MGSETQKLHVFFLPLMAHGHSIPMIDIARLFASRGVKSTIITTPLSASHFSESINRDKQSGQDITIRTIPFPCKEAGLPEGSETFDLLTSQDMIYTFFEALVMLKEPFEQLMIEYHPDCIVSDAYYTWTTDLAKAYNIPRLIFHGSGSFSLSVLENIIRYAPQKKVASDSEIFVVPGLPDQIEMTKSQIASGEDAIITPFIKLVQRMSETEVTSYGVLVNSFNGLEQAYTEYYTKDMGRRAWNIGPVSLYNRNIIDKAQRGKKLAINEHICLNWLNSKELNSVLYISFGSLSQISTAQLLEIAMGLEASDVPFIWVVRLATDQILPEGFEERMDGKGLIVRDWAPQVLILDHPSVGGFMTHCGWNSILEGVSAGLPFITWPIFAEQFINEKLVTQVLKTGIRAGHNVWTSWVLLKDVSVTKDMVEKVVKELMGDGAAAEERRRRARVLGEMAKKAVEEDGSSYTDLTAVIDELRVYSK